MKFVMRDGSGTIDFKYLIEDVDRYGRVRIYLRRKGKKKVALHETPGTPAFIAEYQAALTQRPVEKPKRAAPRSFRWLVERYYESGAFKTLAASTRQVRRGILDGLCQDRFEKEEPHGEKPYADLEPQHVMRLRDQKAEFPESANARVKALRQVFKWAIKAMPHDIKSNPAREVEYLPGNNPDGFHTWTVEQVCQYWDFYPLGTKPRLAMDLMLFTGVRKSDAVKLGKQMERNEELQFTEAKGRRRAPKHRIIPILPPLRASLDACQSGHLTYLVTAFGRPYTPNGFGNWFRRMCDAAGLPDCAAHGLRKAGATFAAENGATEHQLMAMFGWESLKQAELYTRKANRRKLARQGMPLVMPGQSENESVQLPAQVRGVGQNRPSSN